MRVAVVVSHLGLGGAERQTLDLLRQLRGSPWAPVRVICLSTNDSPYGDAVRALGYPLTVVQRTGGFDIGRCLALHRLLRRDEADLVHAVNWFASGYAVLAAPRHTRVISSIRNSHLPAGLARRSIFPLLIRRSTGVVVNSARGRKLVEQACQVPPERIVLVPNGIDVDGVRSAAVPGSLRRELGMPADAPLVAYVGRNARVKNIPRLLGVVRRVLHASPDARVVLAGDGLDSSLVAGTDLAGVPRLFCVGPRRDVASLLRDATVLVLTSDNEGMPNVVLEALASGTPVVATDVGDLSNVLPESCGVLVPADVERLVAATLHVLAHASTYQQAVEQHRPAIASTYSCQAMARRTVEAWKVFAHGVDRPSADQLQLARSG